MYLGQTVWITYLADKLKPGVMVASPGVSGANSFASASSCGPAALWIMPEIPLPASKDPFADITITSLSTAWTLVRSILIGKIVHDLAYLSTLVIIER